MIPEQSHRTLNFARYIGIARYKLLRNDIMTFGVLRYNEIRKIGENAWNAGYLA